MEQSSIDHIKHLSLLEKNLDSMAASAIEDKLRPLEDKVAHRITTIDQKITK